MIEIQISACIAIAVWMLYERTERNVRDWWEDNRVLTTGSNYNNKYEYKKLVKMLIYS